ncbi:hypothetical protein GCG21_10375 [Pseudactinotalea sp. HY160]|uniref:aspartate/glutamate racemase family protein n=1 Tax=Pseudactinotalea sp. HY160 TaxID=2654490 RepID=UPI00128D515B|nr:aspartate/glutamate racemase family protein [Pseudactinotalea sp. HY160]MPV50399.1 hypothetical protein [Pseudactinotalea sp. HY160]
MRVLLVNPNTSTSTTCAMVAMVERELPGVTVCGLTVERGPAMLVDEASLAAAAAETVHAVNTSVELAGSDAVIVAAFGDPGMDALAEALPIPVVGIGSASMLEAAETIGRFGIATTTPALRESIHEQVRALGLADHLACIEITPGDPLLLASDPASQTEALTSAIGAALTRGARGVVIGGGPLGDSADELSSLIAVPVINPVRAACRRVRTLLGRAAEQDGAAATARPRSGG